MRCPAKVNLFLKVTGKRPDGYHTLETLFLPFDGVADLLPSLEEMHAEVVRLCK